jgi:hypothetical protein
MKTIIKKEFDAVKFMRQQRDRISRETAEMTFDQLKEYLRKNRPTDRIVTL